MIAAPLNDQDCLGRLTAVAAQGVDREDVRAIAARFGDADRLAAWIRTLRQRDDEGVEADGPRVQCDVSQRARLVADDPNCVERALMYIAVAEVIDARPMRQLATIDTRNGRHTFPVEDGEPVVLDPAIPRNGLRAGLWMIRNGGAVDGGAVDAADPGPLLGWLADLAEDVAGKAGRKRVRRARRVFRRLVAGRAISPSGRADALYVLRLAAEATPFFGPVGAVGLRLGRSLVARGTARLTVPAQRNVAVGRIAYWGGKAVASYFGVGQLYDAALEPAPRAPPRPTVVTTTDVDAPPAMVLGALDELDDTKGG